MEITISKLFKDMDDTELVVAYWDLRGATDSWSTMARNINPRSRGGRTVARNWGRNVRHFDIVTALLRRRNINPLDTKWKAAS